jgi:geranylgeranyl pyrophosphate synthase
MIKQCDDIVKIIERHEGIQYTQRRAEEYIEKAKRHLGFFPNGKVLVAGGQLRILPTGLPVPDG